MAFLGETYSQETLPQSSRSFDPLPAGWYEASITDATLNDTKDGSGRYVKIRFDILGPTHQGRVVFTNLNLRNRNPKAEEIARQQLGELMLAIGLGQVQDTDQLIGHNLSIKLAIRPATDQYDAANDVKGFKAVASGAPRPAQAPQPQDAGKPAASSSAPPWARK